MHFTHNLIPFQQLEEIYIEGKRHYKTPQGNIYQSVTTLLSKIKDPGLDEWKQKVGEEEATFIKNIMARRGENLHQICENYLNNNPNPSKGFMPDVVGMFRKLAPHVSKINNIRAIEAQLYSDELRLAGRTDVIGDYEFQRAIVDFKTNNSEIDENSVKIHKYFLQCAFYSLMFTERTNLPVNMGVLLNVSNDYGVTVLKRSLLEYFPIARKLAKKRV